MKNHTTIIDFSIIDNSPASKRDYSWNENEVNALRKLVEQEKNLYSRTDDIFLLSFLRARKFDRERAFKLLKSYYSLRRYHLSYFENFTPSAFKEYFDCGIMGYFQHTDLNGRIIGYGRISRWDPWKTHVDELIKMILLLLDMAMNDHLIQVNGVSIIIDTTGTTWRHAIQFTPKSVYRCLSYLLGSYPVRYKEIHLLNVSKMVHAVIALFLPFLPYKLKQRIHIHPNLESLHKFIHPRFLPSDCGGELPPFDHREGIKELIKNEEFFKQNEKYWRVDKPS